MLKLGLGNCRKMLVPLLPNAAHQKRTTFILKRKWEASLDKKGKIPKVLKTKNYVYEEIDRVDSYREPDLKLILKDYVEGVGMKDEIVSVRPNFGRSKLLLPGLAVYASPENLEALSKTKVDTTSTISKFSSKYSEMSRRELARQILCVVVNKENPWTIEKWHIRAAFRRAAFCVPDDAITMGEKTISGPNLDLEGKLFLVTVTINNLETTPVRCQIHHWTTEPEQRLTNEFFWLKPPSPVFEEDEATILALPQPTFKLKKASV